MIVKQSYVGILTLAFVALLLSVHNVRHNYVVSVVFCRMF